MPFKSNADRRHHIPRQRHKVTNWSAYEAGLRARGSLTVWFTAEAIEAWGAEPRTTRGGQPRHSAPATTTALTLPAGGARPLLRLGDHGRPDLARGVPPGAASDRGPSRLRPRPARIGSRRARP